MIKIILKIYIEIIRRKLNQSVKSGLKTKKTYKLSECLDRILNKYHELYGY